MLMLLLVALLIEYFPCGCFVLFLVFETQFLCVTALAILDLALVDQAGFEFTEIRLPLLPECWD